MDVWPNVGDMIYDGDRLCTVLSVEHNTNNDGLWSVLVFDPINMEVKSIVVYCDRSMSMWWTVVDLS